MGLAQSLLENKESLDQISSDRSINRAELIHLKEANPSKTEKDIMDAYAEAQRARRLKSIPTRPTDIWWNTKKNKEIDKAKANASTIKMSYAPGDTVYGFDGQYGTVLATSYYGMLVQWGNGKHSKVCDTNFSSVIDV